MNFVRPARRHTNLTCRVLGAGLALSVMAASPALAQESPAFGAARFSQTPVRGVVSFAGSKVFAWNDGNVRRLVLVGDVRIALGEYSFRSQRADVWMKPLEGGRLQVYVYAGSLRTSARGVDAMGIDAESLPITGVFEPEGAVGLSADLLVQGAPGAGDGGEVTTLLADSRTALGGVLKRSAGVPEEAPAPLPRFTPRTRFAPTPAPTPTAQPGGVKPPETTPPPPASTPRPTPPPVPTPSPRPMTPGTPPAPAPGGEKPVTPQPGAQTPPGEKPSLVPAGAGVPLGAPATGDAIFPREGVVTIAPGDVSFVSAEDENAVVVSNGVKLQYQDIAGDRVLQMSARRAVVFLDPGKVTDMLSLKAEGIRGIYLEGDVSASDGTFTVRGPSVYYDVRANRAIMPDAVLWTFDTKRGIPLYVRAKTVRQEGAGKFSATGARVTNSAFFDPELSLGASRVTVTRRAETASEGGLTGEHPEPGRATTYIEADNITLRAAGVPIFYWPRYSGDPDQRIIKDIRVENRNSTGAGILSTLNAYSLLGIREPRNISADLLADYYFDRGPALGVRAEWTQPTSRGGLLGYMVPFDRGTDVFKPGTKITRDNEFRGIITGEQRWQVDDRWTIFAEGAYISDEGVVDGFFDTLGEVRREFTNRLLARRLEGNSYLALEAKGSFNDFLANEWLLQSRGYSVTKLPEVTYVRQADDVFSQTAPGMVTWFSEYTAGRYMLSLDEVTARDRGLSTNTLAQRALAINFDQSLGSVLRSAGYTEDGVTRLDTRQELSAQFEAGPVHLQPFAVGRLTAYDTDFQSFNAANSERNRAYAGVGLRASATLQRVYDGAESRLLDIHRLRHIIEPNLTVWIAGSNINSADLPVYDAYVEDLTEGASIRIGANHTFQTQRGGPGRWHSVDLLRLSTDLVFANKEAGQRPPVGRFFDFRPEQSIPGNYFIADAAYRLTDATSVTGSTVFDFDLGQQDASSVGLLITHAPGFTSLLDLRYVNPQDSTYLNLGAMYTLSDTYSLAAGANYDLDKSEFQTVGLSLKREFSSLTLGITLQTNQITGETSIGFVIRPYGTEGGVGLGGLGGDPLGASNRFTY